MGTCWGYDDGLGRMRVYLELQGGAQHDRRLRFNTVNCKLDWKPLVSRLTYDIHSCFSYGVNAMPDDAVGTGKVV